MTHRTKTRITIETRKRTLVRATRVRCHQCGAEVSILTPEGAATTLQTSAREIHGLLDSGELHTVEPEAGDRLICANSLPATSSENEIQTEGENQ